MDRLLEATAMAESKHFWFKGFRRFVRPRVASALTGVARPAILDAGAGTGVNLDWLCRYGRTWGLERSRAGLRLAREMGRAGLAGGDVTRLPFATGVFDLVTSFDVIYSLEAADERMALAEAWRVLRPGGALVVNVAALPILRGDHSALSGERRRYTRATLRAALTAAGFDVGELSYTNALLVPLLFVLRARQRRRGLAARTAEITVPPAPINALLTALLAIEAAVSRAVPLPFGSSLLAVARKSKRSPGDVRA
ncbi:MAG: class I SAM-dependent methyltransferase [Acidobacteriota bacterium]|nr:class I SAM-dependent methyltransferase [Acidobacteriota bacterium]